MSSAPDAANTFLSHAECVGVPRSPVDAATRLPLVAVLAGVGVVSLWIGGHVWLWQSGVNGPPGTLPVGAVAIVAVAAVQSLRAIRDTSRVRRAALLGSVPGFALTAVGLGLRGGCADAGGCTTSMRPEPVLLAIGVVVTVVAVGVDLWRGPLRGRGTR